MAAGLRKSARSLIFQPVGNYDPGASEVAEMKMKEYLFNDYKSIRWERQNLRFKLMPKVQVSSIKIGTPIQFDPTRSN